MQISIAGMKFVKTFEGCKIASYQDGAGVWSIGYGHVGGVTKATMITKETADELFDKDRTSFETELNIIFADLMAKGIIKQHHFDAMFSLMFNIGKKAFRNSSLTKAILAGCMSGQKIVESFLLFTKITVMGKKVISKGLKRRRKRESALFLTGDYSL